MQILSHFGCQASLLLKMVREDEDDIDNSIRKTAKQVTKGKSIPLDTTRYRLNIDVQLVDEAISAAIQNLLASLSIQTRKYITSTIDWQHNYQCIAQQTHLSSNITGCVAHSL